MVLQSTPQNLWCIRHDLENCLSCGHKPEDCHHIHAYSWWYDHQREAWSKFSLIKQDHSECIWYRSASSHTLSADYSRIKLWYCPAAGRHSRINFMSEKPQFVIAARWPRDILFLRSAQLISTHGRTIRSPHTPSQIFKDRWTFQSIRWPSIN